MRREYKIFVILALVIVVAAYALGTTDRFGGELFQGDTLALLRLEGPIVNVDWHMEQVRDLAERDEILAVVLRVDSPGGAVAPTQELYSELKRLREIKPVVTSMGTVAASGGYYLSCATDWIVSNPGTITGSVGVIMEFTNLEGLLGKLGIRSRTIKSGRFKDTGNPAREMTEDEQRLLTDMVMDTHEQFVEAVLAGRPVDEGNVRPYFDGRVLTGRQAFGLGLVDQLGNINDAMEKAAELAGLPSVPENIYEPKKDRKGVLAVLLGDAGSATLERIAESFPESGAGRWIQLWRAF
ncbi:MAG: signal peptide peptidase SppA [bacterium]|nr:signal peptide peptidase SppA [bacterium]